MVSVASHGMFSLLWGTGVRDEKIMQETANFLPTQSSLQYPSAMNHVPLVNPMKRKRGEMNAVSPRIAPSPSRGAMETMSHVEIPPPETSALLLNIQAEHEARKQTHVNFAGHVKPISGGTEKRQAGKGEQYTKVSQPRKLEGNPDSPGVTRRYPMQSCSPATLRATIESQFGLDILLKHKELRLIDQELAKCQTALEQLRRCQIIPYPAATSKIEDMLAVSDGSGNVYTNPAPHAPSWGIVNGPYTRHYEKWLIPDSAFDATHEDQAQIPAGAGKTVSQRPTRGSKAEITGHTTAQRSQRGSNSSRLVALPHGYPEPKEEKGPCIVKRSSDGHMVKLVCLDCRRHDFSSAQGFINHCRISHSRQFLSHDAAIEASGEEIDMDANQTIGDIAGVQTSSSTVGLVHPLIRSALSTPSPSTPTIVSNRKKARLTTSNIIPSSAQDPKSATMLKPKPQTDRALDLANRLPLSFNPCPQTPHLSALFKKLGRGDNLFDMVTDATTKPDIDMDQLSEEEDDDLGMDDAPEQTGVQSRSTRGVLRAGDTSSAGNITDSPSGSLLNQRQLGDARKPHPIRFRSPQPLHSSSYHLNSQDQSQYPDTSLSISNTPVNLSPNSTDPHPAPSLVSDDGDLDNSHSDSDSSNSPDPAEEDDHYVHAEVVNDDDMELGDGNEINLDHPEKARRPTERRRSNPLATIRGGSHEGRHVSFASPIQQIGKGSRVSKKT